MRQDISADWRYGQWSIIDDRGDEWPEALCVIPPGVSITEMETRLSRHRGVPMRLRLDTTRSGLQLE